MISWGILSRASVQVLARSLLESRAIAFITSLFSRRVQLVRCLLCISFDVGEIRGGEPCALCIDDSATRVANDYARRVLVTGRREREPASAVECDNQTCCAFTA
jgi:hypothetical protein